MKRWIFSILGFSFVVIIVWFVVSWLENGGGFSSGPVGGSLPPHISYVIPKDGEQVDDPFGFCVHFDYQAGEGMGHDPQTTVKYYLDGRNETEKIYDLISLEYPTQVGEPCLVRSEALNSGWHTVKVTYEDISGMSYAYKWRFQSIEGE